MNAPLPSPTRPDLVNTVPRVTLDGVAAIGERAMRVLSDVRQMVMEPFPRKAEPTVSGATLCKLCRIDRQRLAYLVAKGELPPGRLTKGGRSREFLVSEAFTWVKALRSGPKRPANKRGRICGVSIYKGGVGKTTTAVMLAQALALRGFRVLIVDCDPQGSATALMGVSPETEVDAYRQTVLGSFYEREEAEGGGWHDSLDFAVQPTFWPNLDLIAACSTLFEAEFVVPSRYKDGQRDDFWNWIAPPLRRTADQYDFVILDTPPSLSYLTLNAIFAADALVMPLPLEPLDFASSAQFWSLLSETFKGLEGSGLKKKFDFVKILPTRTKVGANSEVVRNWISRAYGTELLPIEIPDSSAIRDATLALSTIYELGKPPGSREAYDRVRSPMDDLADMLEHSLALAWERDDAEEGEE